MDISGETRFSNVPTVFGAAVAAGPERPMLTYYDDATGERTELSGTTLANWVAKTANLLVDGCGLGPGDRAAVILPPHWQTAAVLLGAWSAGLEVAMIDPRFADLPSSSEVMSAQYDVEFTAVKPLFDKVDATDRFVLGLAPMAMPLREVPDGFVDYVTEVRQHGDHFTPIPGRGPAATTDGTTYEEWGRGSMAMAEHMGIREGDRVLIDTGELTHPIQWLLTPLAARASVVLCTNLDKSKLAARAEAERVTRILPASIWSCCRWSDRFVAQQLLDQRDFARRSNASRDSGFARAPRAAAWSSGVPVRMRFTGTSSFLPDRVRGTAPTWKTSSGTCRGDSAVRNSRASRFRSSASSSTPSASTTNSSRSPGPPAASSRWTTTESATSSSPSTTE